MKKKILFTHSGFSEADKERLLKGGIEIKEAPGDLSEELLIKELQGCQGYIIGGADKATKKVIENTNLEIIVFYGTGYENYVDIKAASAKGVAVANTPKANAYTVAEHTIALILDAVKGITWLNNSTKKGEWERRTTWNLQNKTLGIVGLGTIGTYVARILHRAFEVKVIYSSRNKKEDVEKELGAKKVELNELFSQADIISIHTAYNPNLVDMIGEEQFSLMKKNSVLVNAARAELVDPKALKKALENNIFSTAAFDAYYMEPVPKPKDDEWGLLSLSDKKFIVTPHTAYGSAEAFQKMNNMVIENLLGFFEKGKAPYSVN